MSGRQRPPDTCSGTRHDRTGAEDRGAQACVKRALEAVRDALTRDPATSFRLPEIASAAGVSPRTLQRHFARVLRLPLQSVMQRLRLEAARQTLQADEVSSLLDAALRNGFGHPGRFAAIYARVFGDRTLAAC